MLMSTKTAIQFTALKGLNCQSGKWLWGPKIFSLTENLLISANLIETIFGNMH